jgi:hypothetical protein
VEVHPHRRGVENGSDEADRSASAALSAQVEGIRPSMAQCNSALTATAGRDGADQQADEPTVAGTSLVVPPRLVCEE